MSTLLEALRFLLGSLPARRRAQLALLAVLMLGAAVAEMLSLGAVVPFLAVLAEPARAFERPWMARLAAFLNVDDVASLRWQFTLLFASAAVLASAVRFLLVYVIARVNFGVGHELGAELYRRTLYQPYEVHVSRNSSEIIGAISKVDIVVWTVFSLLNMCSAIVIAGFILVALVMIDARVAIPALAGFGGIYAVTSFLTRKRLARNSKLINAAFNGRIQSVQEGLGAIRDVLLDHAQSAYLRRFSQVDWPMRQAQASNNIIGPSPRFLVEALGMVLIAVLAYALTASQQSVGATLPVLGALALGAQRLMPLLQQIYQGWAVVASERHVVLDVVNLLAQPMAPGGDAPATPLPFQREISFEKVCFRYKPDTALVLEDIDMVVPKGARVGLIGPTGSGKSTAMDLLLGLLQPTEGRIMVDGEPLGPATRLRWQASIAHVPQAIFLADGSFAENIALGIPMERVDLSRVREAARQAQIDLFIESQPGGYAARVGERGLRLSGGQRQRIGIARALYKQAKVLVFDEATSSLDSETETAVMQSIESLGRDLTIVLIAHRVTTLRSCDFVYRLDKGRITRADLNGLELTANVHGGAIAT